MAEKRDMQSRTSSRSSQQKTDKKKDERKGSRRPFRFGRNSNKKPQVHKLHDKLKIIILGGNEEVGGRNMTLVEYDKDIVLIDMGLKFPDEDMHGIDYIIPNISYLKGKEKQIRAVTLTHGHLDHIGAVSHLIPELGNPTIYTGKFTAGMIKRRHAEYKNLPALNVKICDETSKIKAGKMMIEFVPVNHSIPDSFGILIHTPVGSIFHTGDFKFDFSPVDGKPANLARYAEIGENGLLALMSDSTGANKPGYQISEAVVGKELEKVFASAPQRIYVGLVASNLSRIIQILEIADKLGRKVAMDGRSLKNIVDLAFELGYININRKIMIEPQEVKKYPAHKVMVLLTGSQGEPNAALPRVVAGDHKCLRLEGDDTVVFSASIIPGNENSLARLLDGIYRHGCKVYNYKMLEIHAGGHGNQEDQKLMIRLMKPEFFIPIEGSYSFLAMHANSAAEVGIPRERILIPDNGQVMEFYKDKRNNKLVGRISDKTVITDSVMVDGLGVGDVSNIVLRDRQVMAEDGMFVIIATVDCSTGNLVGSPDIISRGFVYMKENRELIEAARKKVKSLFKKHSKKKPDFQIEYIKNKIRDEVGYLLYKKTKRRPMILPVIIDV
jgi:ribonuclease J